MIKQWSFGLLLLLASMSGLAATTINDLYLEDFPSGLWTGYYRYVSCEDREVTGEGKAHLTVEQVTLDEPHGRAGFTGTLSLIGFPDDSETPDYSQGVKLDLSEIIKTRKEGFYNAYLDPVEGPTFSGENGYQPMALTLIVAIARCDGNPYQIYLTLNPPPKPD